MNMKNKRVLIIQAKKNQNPEVFEAQKWVFFIKEAKKAKKSKQEHGLVLNGTESRNLNLKRSCLNGKVSTKRC
jgi:hypothetical protein